MKREMELPITCRLLFFLGLFDIANASSVLLSSGQYASRQAVLLPPPPPPSAYRRTNADVSETDSYEYYGGGFFLDDIQAVARPDTLECPSSNVISTRYKCQFKDEWVDCYRKHCCQGYNFVAGRCLSESVNPCSQKFCEQKCSVFFGRVICTCYSGYKFSPENHKNGISPVCIDQNECEVDNGGCDHECINIDGGHSCKCESGYHLLQDKRSCESLQESLLEEGFSSPHLIDLNAMPASSNEIGQKQKERRSKCFAPCGLVSSLENKIKLLNERLTALSTAVRLYSFAAGPPGPEGQFGPPGSMGRRGFPGPAGPQGATGIPGKPGRSLLLDELSLTQDDYPFNSWAVVKNKNKRQFCKCRRGAVGPAGAPGRDGQVGQRGDPGTKGQKGDPGSFDFLLLMMADLKHDIYQLQEKVFGGEQWPEPFDLDSVLDSEFVEPLDKTRYKLQLQELLTEESDNEIYGAGKLFQADYAPSGHMSATTAPSALELTQDENEKSNPISYREVSKNHQDRRSNTLSVIENTTPSFLNEVNRLEEPISGILMKNVSRTDDNFNEIEQPDYEEYQEYFEFFNKTRWPASSTVLADMKVGKNSFDDVDNTTPSFLYFNSTTLVNENPSSKATKSSINVSLIEAMKNLKFKEELELQRLLDEKTFQYFKKEFDLNDDFKKKSNERAQKSGGTMTTKRPIKVSKATVASEHSDADTSK